MNYIVCVLLTKIFQDIIVGVHLYINLKQNIALTAVKMLVCVLSMFVNFISIS